MVIQVECVECHPQKPLLATFDRKNYLTIWDYARGQAVFEAQFGPESHYNRDALEAVARVENDADFFGRRMFPVLVNTVLQPANYGKLRSLQFIDYNAMLWTVMTQHMIQQHGANAAQPLGAVSASLPNRCVLMITCDRAVVQFDVIRQRAKWFLASNPSVGGKGFYCAAAMPRTRDGAVAQHPVIAVACTDGFIRLVDDFDKPSVTALLALKSGTVVSTMAVVPIAGRDALFVGDEKGTIHVFDPTQKPQTLEKGVVAVTPVHTLKSYHKERICAIVFAPMPDPARPKACVVTVSECNRIAVWDAEAPAHAGGTSHWGTAQLVASCRPKDAKITGAAPLISDVLEPSEGTVLLSTAKPQVLALSLAQASVSTLTVLNDLPERDGKKAPKLYAIAVPALRPSVVAVATNAGVALLSCDMVGRRRVAALPAAVHFVSDVTDPSASGDLLGLGDAPVGEAGGDPLCATILTLAGNSLVARTFRAGGDDQFEAAHGLPLSEGRMEHLQSRLTGTARTALPPGASSGSIAPDSVLVHPQGSLIAVCSRWLHSVAVLSSTNGGHSWHDAWQFSGREVAWHSSADTLAVLVLPTPRASRPTPGKVKAKDAVRQAVLARQQAATSGNECHVDIAPLGQATRRVQLPDGAQPFAVHGGPVLGVSVTRPGSGASGGGGSARDLLLIDWASGTVLDGAAGAALPVPDFITYSPGGEFAAFVHATHIRVYQLGARLTPVSHISAVAAQSALWLGTVLFVATEAAVTAYFIIPPAPEGQQLSVGLDLFSQVAEDGLPTLTGVPTAMTYAVQSVEIAVGGVTPAPSPEARSSAGLPSPALRPGEIFRLAHVTPETLWMATAAGHVWAMSLTHPGLRCRLLTSQGDPRAARRLAADALPLPHHDALARFMAAFGADSASQAMLLPGLTLQLKLALSIQAGALKRAHACLCALLAGCRDRTLLSQFDAWRHANAPPAEEQDSSKPQGGKDKGEDPFASAAAPGGPTQGRVLGVSNEVIAIFKQAAGVQGQAVLKQLTQFGIQGRAAPLDQDLFKIPDPEAGKAAADGAAKGAPGPALAAPAPPPSSSKYKPMFPRKLDAQRTAPVVPRPAGASADTGAVQGDTQEAPRVEEDDDVIDWGWPLRPPPGVTAGGAAEGANGAEPDAKDGGADGDAAEEGGDADAGAPGRGGPDSGAGVMPGAAKPETLELGLLLLDAAVKLSDREVLQATVALMAPHTGVMTAAQQARLVAAVGACGLAKQLSDLTLSGTTPILPTGAMLAGFLAGDARVMARVLEKQAFVPLKALFVQSCGVGGIDESVEWENQLKLRMGGPTRPLTITPQTS